MVNTRHTGYHTRLMVNTRHMEYHARHTGYHARLMVNTRHTGYHAGIMVNTQELLILGRKGSYCPNPLNQGVYELVFSGEVLFCNKRKHITDLVRLTCKSPKPVSNSS